MRFSLPSSRPHQQVTAVHGAILLQNIGTVDDAINSARVLIPNQCANIQVANYVALTSETKQCKTIPKHCFVSDASTCETKH